MLPDISIRLPKLALLAGLSEGELRIVSKYMHLRKIDVGKMICSAGDPLIGAGMVVRGRLELLTSPPRRRLALVEAGDAFGLTALVAEGPQALGCRAVAPSVVVTIRREDFLYLAGTHGSLGIHLLTQLLGQLASQLRRMDGVLQELEAPPPPRPSEEVLGQFPVHVERKPPIQRSERPVRPRRLSAETGDQILDMIQQYSVKAGLEDLDNVRVVRTGYQRMNEFGSPSYRRR